MLSLHYNGSNSCLFVINVTKNINSKHNSEIKSYPLNIGIISKDFTANNVKKKPGLNGYIYDFSIDYNTIYKYLMKEHDIKKCVNSFKKYLLDY